MATVPWYEETLAVDIHESLIEKELQLQPYKGQSPQLHQRRYLVDWLAAVCDECSVCNEAKHLAVHLLDMFMDHYEIDPERIHLVVLGCLLIACKFEEAEVNIPRWYVLDKSIVNSEYEAIHYQQMELLLLEYFGWNIGIPTACHFAHFYMISCLKFEREHISNVSLIEKIELYMDKYVKYFLEISLQDHSYRFHAPSLVALACVAASRACMQLIPIWPECLSAETRFTWEQVVVPVQSMLRTYQIDEKATKDETTPPRGLQDSGYSSPDCNTPSPGEHRYSSASHPHPTSDCNNNELSPSSCKTPPERYYSTLTSPASDLQYSGARSVESGIMSCAASPTQLDLVANFNEEMVL